MHKSTIQIGSGCPISQYLPSPSEVEGNPDSIFSTSLTLRDTCNLTTYLCIHNRTAIMYNSYNVLKNCTIENIRTDEKALIFSVITDGSVCEIINGCQVEHGKGAINMGIMSSENVHIQHLVAGSKFEKISIMMSESDYKIYNKRYPIIFSRFDKHFSSNKPFVGDVVDQFGKILEAAYDLQKAVLSRNVNPYFVEGLIVECLVNYYYDQFKQTLPDNYNICRKIFKARTILSENFKNPPTLHQLAAKVGTNECTLKKVFKQMFSVTVFDYLNDLRMSKAAYYLAENELSINDIATMLGFSSQSHFSTAFRKWKGVSPKEYRDNNIATKLA